MNYGEGLGYWYLRLNGFFPLTNFVLHKASEVKYSSDCDIIAIRTPHVKEKIGGMLIDRDKELEPPLDFSRTVGLICEVKTGDFEVAKVLDSEKVNAAVDRLGFVEDSTEARDLLRTQKYCLLGNQYQIAKLFIADRRLHIDRPFLFLPLEHIQEFIKHRFEQYEEKFRDRVYFNSELIQYLTWEAELKRRRPT